MTAAIAFQATTTPAASALTGVVAPASAQATAQTAGEDFAAALAALLNGNVATAQPQVTQASKPQKTATEVEAASGTAVDPSSVTQVLPAVPTLILTESLSAPTSPAAQSDTQATPAAQINAQAAQSSALQILQAAVKGVIDDAVETPSANDTNPASAQAQLQVQAQAQGQDKAQPQAQIPTAAFAALAANAQQPTQAAPAASKAPVKAASAKETPATAKASLEPGNVNTTTPAPDSKASASAHFAGAIEHALSNNGNGGQQPGNTCSNQNSQQLAVTAAPVAVAIHTASVDTTATAAPAPASQPQLAVPVDTLAVHIARKFEGGENRFEIRLDPIELGKLDISMSVDHDGRVQAVVRAERPETLDMLQRDARVLENQLRQSGLNVDSNSLSFSLGNGNNQRSAFAGAGQSFANAFDAAPEAEATATATTVVNLRDGVDIRI